ncbi:MAG TPA: hypothetical protein VF407_16740, partial [Polyangiaceae bacterium]
ESTQKLFVVLGDDGALDIDFVTTHSEASTYSFDGNRRLDAGRKTMVEVCSVEVQQTLRNKPNR